MYVGRVTLRNIRGFRDLEFDFDRGQGRFAGWTVITGDNGSGKSALLKAIAVGLVGTDTARSLQPSFHRWMHEGRDVDEATIELDIHRIPEDDALVKKGRIRVGSFPAKMLLRNGSKETALYAVPKSKTPQRTLWAPDAWGWFSCGYGPFRRVFGASPEATRQMVAPATERFVTMFQEAASLAEVDQWLRLLKHKELEHKTAEQQALAIVLNILRDDLLPNEMVIDRVDSDGLWLRDRNGVQLSWGEMSDGYRAALALLADILRHLINTYGVDRPPTERSGVVLIDEIDAHLHPEWQREIGFWLKRHFPKIQFLVTTHSPIICQAADRNGLFVLPEPGSDRGPRALTANEYQKVIASRPDTILLTSAFGMQNTRSPRAVEGRAIRSRLKSKQRAGGKLTNEEMKQFQQLELFDSNDEDDE